MIKLTILIFSLLIKLTYSNEAISKVWTSKNKWNNNWEKKYSDWVENKVKTTIFTTGKWKDIETDCADAIYITRAIFAYENSLPFEFRNPNKYGQRFSNKITQFNKFTKKEDLRFRKFITWMNRLLSTYTLPYDTYSPEISKGSVKPGDSFLLHHNHVYLIKSIDAFGITKLLSSTVPSKVRTLDLEFLVPEVDDETMITGLSGFRAWRWPNQLFWSKNKLKRKKLYSDTQYNLYADSKKDKENSFEDLISLRLSGGIRETAEKKIKRYMDHTVQQILERVSVVNEGYRYTKNLGRKLTKTEFYNYSTPSRDNNLVASLNKLVELNSDFTHKHNYKVDILKDSLKDQTFEIKKGIKINLFKFINDIYEHEVVLGSDPYLSIEKRWGI